MLIVLMLIVMSQKFYNKIYQRKQLLPKLKEEKRNVKLILTMKRGDKIIPYQQKIIYLIGLICQYLKSFA